MFTRSEGGPGQILTLTPGATLNKLVLNRNFDLRALPMNDETRTILSGVRQFEAHLLPAQDLF